MKKNRKIIVLVYSEIHDGFEYVFKLVVASIDRSVLR